MAATGRTAALALHPRNLTLSHNLQIGGVEFQNLVSAKDIDVLAFDLHHGTAAASHSATHHHASTGHSATHALSAARTALTRILGHPTKLRIWLRSFDSRRDSGLSNSGLATLSER